MRKLLFNFAFLITFLSNAQEKCDCLINLNHFANKVSANYAGFKDKVNSKTEVSYNILLDSLRKATSKSQSLKQCYDILEKYRLFFYDNHLQLGANLPAEVADKAVETNEPTNTTWTKKSISDYLKTKKLNAIEGVWTSAGYEVGIVFNPKLKSYDGIVLNAKNQNWKEGMLKFRSEINSKSTYKTDYSTGNFSKEMVKSVMFKNFMEFEKFGIWKKTFPVTNDTISELDFNTKHSDFGKIQLKYFDDNTVYIAIKSCAIELKSTVEAMMTQNAEKLKTIPNWIVDFRGNNGGDTQTYNSLLPYFYTKEYKSDGSKNYLSPENVAKWQNMLNANRKNFDTATIDYLEKRIDFGLKNPNSWYDDEKEDVLKYDKILDFPKRVAILSDKKNGSSGETFLIVAKGISNKVIVFGENSGGYLDYGNLNDYEMPCENFSLSIPMRRANYLDNGISYDKNGYPPDVYIKKDNKNWIEFVKDYWKNKN